MEHRRRSIRLKGYDYSQVGAYFVTICTRRTSYGSVKLFGNIVDGRMILNDAGHVVRQCWLDIPDHFSNMELDEFVVMPNHVHGIIAIVDTKHFSRPTNDTSRPHGTSKTIGSAIRGFKIGVTKWMRNNTGVHDVWQRNYYERIIRDHDEFENIREYISRNPAKWEFDRNNP